jgi:hypothetical protein
MGNKSVDQLEIVVEKHLDLFLSFSQTTPAIDRASVTRNNKKSKTKTTTPNPVLVTTDADIDESGYPRTISKRKIRKKMCR